MIGHCALPAGNHYEIIQNVSAINRNYSILLPLSYGDKKYGDIIKKEALEIKPVRRAKLLAFHQQKVVEENEFFARVGVAQKLFDKTQTIVSRF